MKALTLFFSIFCLTLPLYANTVIGRVDIQKILLSVEEGKRVRDKLKKEFEKKQGELQKDEADIRKMQEDYQKQSLVMSDKAKAKKEKEIQERILSIQKKSNEYQQEIQELEQKYKKPILEKVRVIIEEVSKKAGVDMTFEASTAPIVYAKNKKDLTDEVIKIYNSKHK